MPEKSLEERVSERSTDQALALLSVNITTLICQLDNVEEVIADLNTTQLKLVEGLEHLTHRIVTLEE